MDNTTTTRKRNPRGGMKLTTQTLGHIKASLRLAYQRACDFEGEQSDPARVAEWAQERAELREAMAEWEVFLSEQNLLNKAAGLSEDVQDLYEWAVANGLES